MDVKQCAKIIYIHVVSDFFCIVVLQFWGDGDW
jgi:hypothetical protein